MTRNHFLSGIGPSKPLHPVRRSSSDLYIYRFVGLRPIKISRKCYVRICDEFWKETFLFKTTLQSIPMGIASCELLNTHLRSVMKILDSMNDEKWGRFQTLPQSASDWFFLITDYVRGKRRALSSIVDGWTKRNCCHSNEGGGVKIMAKVVYRWGGLTMNHRCGMG